MKMSHKKKLLDAEAAEHDEHDSHHSSHKSTHHHDDHDDDHDDDNGCCTNGFYDTYMRPCWAEFLGSVLFTFIAGMVAMTAQPTTIAVGVGLGAIIISIMFAPVSGGHYNPALTLAVLITGQIKPLMAFFYVLFQLVGAIAGAAIVLGLADDTQYINTSAGVPMIVGSLSIGEALALEAVLGYILVMVVLIAQVDEQNHLAPIAHGFVYLVGILISAAQSGGAINPLRSFGASVMWSIEETDHWEEQWIYYVASAGSAVIAAISYKLHYASTGMRWKCQEGKKNH